jgi:hypothetical protein
MFTTELTIADGTDEIEVTGLSQASTNDTWGVLSIETIPDGALAGVTSIGLHVEFATTSVQLSGAQTVAGVKTFSSDPIIPDEVYGAGWNGSLEPPTKNAVYDKIETISAGGVDTANSPNAGEWAKFTDADTIEGRTDAELIADLSLEVGVDLQAHDDFLDDIAALTDPGADRIAFWDDSVGAIVWLTVGTGLTITDDTIDASGGSGDVATDAIWDAAGDLAVGSGANTAARLAIGTALQVLRVNSGATALEWAAAGSSDFDDIITHNGEVVIHLDNVVALP